MHTQGPRSSRALQTLLCAAISSIALILLNPSNALAQSLDVSFDPSGDDFTADDDSATFNIQQCRTLFSDDFDVQITIDVSKATLDTSEDQRYAVKLETESNACDDDDLTQSSDTCIIVNDTDDLPTAGSETATFSYPFKDLFNLSSLEDCIGQSLTVNIVVVYEITEIDPLTNEQEDTETSSDNFSLSLSTVRPTGVPSELSATSGESSITVSYVAADPEPEDAEYIIYLADTGSSTDPDNTTSILTPGSAPEDYPSSVRTISASGNTEFTIDSGLSVNRTYEIAVVVADADGNESVLSEVITETTQPTDDFFEVYTNAGGSDTGGFCTISSTSPTPHPSKPLSLLLLLTIGAFTVRTFKRRNTHTTKQHNTHTTTALLISSSALALTLLASPTQANAQTAPNLPEYDTSEHTSGTFELRFGSYLPDVDSEFNGNDGPYSQVFGNESLLLAEFSLSRNFGEFAGIWAVSFDLGFMQAVGKSLTAQGTKSPDTTVFNIIPFRTALNWRINLLQKHLSIPFVPVLKAGLDYSLWWVTDGAGDIAQAGDNEAFGGTFGWHGAFALHFLLDSLDQRAAQNLLFDFGIQNSYLFAEYLYAQVDDFSSSSSMNLSDDAFMFGLAFDY